MKSCFLAILVLLTAATPTLAADLVSFESIRYAAQNSDGIFRAYMGFATASRTNGDWLIFGVCREKRRHARELALRECRSSTSGDARECTVFEVTSDRWRQSNDASRNWRDLPPRGCSYTAFAYNPSEAPIDL